MPWLVRISTRDSQGGDDEQNTATGWQLGTVKANPWATPMGTEPPIQGSVACALRESIRHKVVLMPAEMAETPKVRMIPVCEACERGEGGECHTPGCSFWMRDGPKEPLQFLGIDLSTTAIIMAHLARRDQS